MFRTIILLSALLFLASCAGTDIDREKAPLVLKPASYRHLPGWRGDEHAEVLRAFRRSCERIIKASPSAAFGPEPVFGTYADWQPACRRVAGGDVTDARAFFEEHFSPYLATAAGREREGLFTGYYEASLEGARQRFGPYQYPLRARPDDLVMVDLGAFREELKGRRIAGRVVDGRLQPYEDRRAIVNNGLPPRQDKPLVWVDDPVDAFFLHIQGSGRVDLADGGHMRVGYAAQNGHPYYAIGRELVHRGYLEKDEVSLQSIRKWLRDNPEQAAEIMNTNRSYVFFHELKGEGPLGAEGLPLTPGRSLAVDRTKIPYGLPLWVDIDPPQEDAPRLRRLMVAQDTGGAIRGPVRGDFFWGHGPQAEEWAGKMKSQGQYWLLLPRTLDVNA